MKPIFVLWFLTLLFTGDFDLFPKACNFYPVQEFSLIVPFFFSPLTFSAIANHICVRDTHLWNILLILSVMPVPVQHSHLSHLGSELLPCLPRTMPFDDQGGIRFIIFNPGRHPPSMPPLLSAKTVETIKQFALLSVRGMESGEHHLSVPQGRCSLLCRVLSPHYWPPLRMLTDMGKRTSVLWSGGLPKWTWHAGCPRQRWDKWP